MKEITLLFLLLLCANCNKYQQCNDLLSACVGSPKGTYCLFGYKWGAEPEFESRGVEAIGPGLSGGIITYSFHTEEKVISIHNRKNVKTTNFDYKGACAREQVIKALKEYEQYGNFEFLEEEDNALSNIQFLAVQDEGVNVGNTNYQDKPCTDISGKIVFNRNWIDDCDRFFILALHEIGHALGLGHVDSENIMQQGNNKYQFGGLQQGDIAGIISIYGMK
ncbi:MAG: matrixin family metalloprotease [Bacteroidota bacterium]